MQPHTPVIQAKGQGEAQAELQITGRTELKAAYSPLKHILVMGAATGRPSRPIGTVTEADVYRTLQYEVGAGVYFPIGTSWTMQGVVGTGAASTQRTVSEFGILLSFSNDYAARYRKNYGQLGLVHHEPRADLGFGYRLMQVNFRELWSQDRNEPYTQYLLPHDRQLRHEFYSFYRHSVGSAGRWQLQLSVATSATVPGRGLVNPYTEESHRARFNRGACLLLGGGVVWRPASLGANGAAGGAP